MKNTVKSGKTIMIVLLGVLVVLAAYGVATKKVTADSAQANDMMGQMMSMMSSHDEMHEGMEQMHQECMGMMGSTMGSTNKKGMSPADHESHHS